ncbi:MAG: SulP family inorganic anion transporter [Verrucomicrobia bacterium]|jgi:sulfate permease, SulP family|nr:SulP family inorganic anion transporter [Verrucomicrobiota bacterium]MBT7065271.1 SulP family inorganic anion transporter [Verrucomicrobiota bacterium]MBT7700230.1 SulP family inorganic anion transporter [Verrucomicrobiota bacterium]
MTSKAAKSTKFQLKIQRPRSVKNDILSGLTVALALVPEAVAFSFVAKVDPVVGLYAAFMMGLITAIFGGRPGMISGATGAVAVIFAPLMIGLYGDGVDTQTATGYLFAAVIMMGIFQMVFGVLRLGKFIRLVPHPVMLGFVNGLAIIIFKSQFEMFYVGHGEHAQLLGHVPLLIMCAMIAMTMAISFFLPKLTKAVPATLVAIVTVTVLSLLLKKFGIHESRNVLDFVQSMDPTKETIAAGLPTFGYPQVAFNWANIRLILPYSALAAAVGLIESLMTLTLVDEITETRGRGNLECIGQGLANVINGFFGGMGGCAMIGQSMINIRGGGRGRLSGISAALFLLAMLLFAAPLVEIVPLAALVGVMFMVVIGTFEWSSFRVLGSVPKMDAFIIILVSVITVMHDLAIAVLVGIIVSAMAFAWEHGKKIHAKVSTAPNGAKIYHLESALFFGSAQSFKDLFDPTNDPQDVVIDFEDARVYDHSGIEAINNITERYAEQGKLLHLLNLSPECKDLLHKADNIVELSVIEDLNWQHVADDRLA